MLADRLQELVWRLRFGKSRRKITSEEVISDLSKIERPIFFLSTGRTGTRWFTDYLKHHDELRVLHSPIPNLSVQNKFIYNIQMSRGINADTLDIAKQIFLTGRGEYLRYYYKTGKRYIETNNHITFFAHALNEMFPDARFVHLHRDPVGFVTSGLKRGWFGENKQANEKMITSANNPFNTAEEKIAWLWSETNRFICDFTKSLGPDKSTSLSLNDFNEKNVSAVMEFMGVQPKPLIRELINIKSNASKSEKKEVDMDASMKSRIGDICRETASLLGYH